MEYPDLLKEDKLEIKKQLFPADAIDRATLLKKHIKSVGAYSMSQGIPHIRENVAKFISGISLWDDTYNRTGRNTCLSRERFSHRRSITGRQLPASDYPRITQRRYINPYSSISTLHRDIVSPQRSTHTILSQRRDELVIKPRGSEIRSRKSTFRGRQSSCPGSHQPRQSHGRMSRGIHHGTSHSLMRDRKPRSHGR